MKRMEELILLTANKWMIPGATPKTSYPFELKCTIIQLESTEMFINPFDLDLPPELITWWNRVKSARLFEDTNYGQWGLEVLSPDVSLQVTNECLIQRKEDFFCTDIVIGKFLGDSELVMVSCGSMDFGAIYIVEPIYGREDWSIAAHSLGEFLELYIAAEGDKYWEAGLPEG
jgi:hypothetical protein